MFSVVEYHEPSKLHVALLEQDWGAAIGLLKTNSQASTKWLTQVCRPIEHCQCCPHTQLCEFGLMTPQEIAATQWLRIRKESKSSPAQRATAAQLVAFSAAVAKALGKELFNHHDKIQPQIDGLNITFDSLFQKNIYEKVIEYVKSRQGMLSPMVECFLKLLFTNAKEQLAFSKQHAFNILTLICLPSDKKSDLLLFSYIDAAILCNPKTFYKSSLFDKKMKGYLYKFFKIYRAYENNQLDEHEIQYLKLPRIKRNQRQNQYISEQKRHIAYLEEQLKQFRARSNSECVTEEARSPLLLSSSPNQWTAQEEKKAQRSESDPAASLPLLSMPSSNPIGVETSMDIAELSGCSAQSTPRGWAMVASKPRI